MLARRVRAVAAVVVLRGLALVPPAVARVTVALVGTASGLAVVLVVRGIAVMR
ncbi:MAG: hypothetical protein WBM00_08985 [Solirubrobacterales bacterium]